MIASALHWLSRVLEEASYRVSSMAWRWESVPPGEGGYPSPEEWIKFFEKHRPEIEANIFKKNSFFAMTKRKEPK